MSLNDQADPRPAPARGSGRPFPRLLFCLGLMGVIWAVYWQVAGHQFLAYDDRTYVAENSRVLQGLSWPNLRWALTAFHDANWFPLTWLSHMLDVQLFGRDPAGHHLVNVGIHSLNAVLCFLVLSRMTASPWRSAVVAAIFALHPLRVESVAWVAERKDVLSALFWFLTMYAYVRFVADRRAASYVAVLGCFIGGLMAKPMLVTLPFLLLLLDYWPLGRLAAISPPGSVGRQVPLRAALVEKLPLVVLATASSVVTFIAQRRGGTVSSFDHTTVLANLGNAFFSYLVYLKQLVWPVGLAVFYPFSVDRLLGKSLFALPLLVGATYVIVRQLKRRPYLASGWFWYLGTMVPVIGFVKVGAHAHADRYTYLPLIGITIMLVWLVAELTSTWPGRKPLLAAVVLVVVGGSSLLTFRQLGHWQDSFTLFRHTLAVTKENWLAHNNLSTELIRWGKFDEAYAHLQEAVRIRPDYASAHLNLGVVYTTRQQTDLAIEANRKALEFDPVSVNARFNLGAALLKRDDIAGAYEQYRRLATLNEQQADALLGMIRFAESRKQRVTP